MKKGAGFNPLDDDEFDINLDADIFPFLHISGDLWGHPIQMPIQAPPEKEIPQLPKPQITVEPTVIREKQDAQDDEYVQKTKRKKGKKSKSKLDELRKQLKELENEFEPIESKKNEELEGLDPELSSKELKAEIRRIKNKASAGKSRLEKSIRLLKADIKETESKIIIHDLENKNRELLEEVENLKAALAYKERGQQEDCQKFEVEIRSVSPQKKKTSVTFQFDAVRASASVRHGPAKLFSEDDVQHKMSQKHPPQ